MKPDSTDTAANAPDESEGAPGYAEASLNEFPEGAGELDEPSRRRFLTYMGASIALATGAGCNLRPAAQRKIYPYTTQPDEITPGVPLYFASAHPFGGFGTGVLVRSNEGRPTKVEGNPDHPGSLGGTALHAQASVLDLYDPNRSTGATHRGQPMSYDQVVSALRGKLFTGNNNANTGLRIRVLTETVTSPTLVGQMTALLNTFPSARWVQFEAVSAENSRNGYKKAFGKDVNVSYDFLKADVVLALEADFLCSGSGHARYARDFADRRKIRENGKDRAELDAGRQPGRTFKEGVKVGSKADPKDSLLNRLYAVECMPTNTGAVADHRIALTTAQIGSFVSTLAVALKVPGVSAAGSWSEGQAKWLGALAEDLLAKRGKSIVVAGDHLPAWVHTLVAAINHTLGNVGSTVKVTAPVVGQAAPQFAGKVIDIKTLTDELKAKAIDVLLVLGGANPAYSAPAELDFAGALKAFGADTSKFSLHLGSHQDETGVLCAWHIPEAHFLETWGDIRAYDGTASIQQPLIAPLHGGKSAIELIGTLMRPAEATVPGSSRDPMDIVMATWSNADEVKKTFPNYQKPAIFAPFWQECVRSGVIAGTNSVEEKAGLAANWAEGLGAGTGPAVGADELELNFRACPSLYDGRFATNGWLQELPKPLTKISWDNAAFVSPQTAATKFGGLSPNFRWTGGEHGRAEVGLVEIKVKVKFPDGKEEERSVKAPVWVLPGHADGAVTIHLGHGRERAGRPAMLADYRVVKPSDAGADEKNAEGKPVHGFNAYPLRAGSTWAVGAKVARTAGKYLLAQTQGHWSMAQKDPISGKMLDRKPVRRGSLDDFKKNPLFAKIPPMATGETVLINENVPLPKKKGEEKGGHGNGHDAHARITPLNMYNPAEGLVPDLRESQRRRWAMAIDLSSCTGCSACVVACVSENNSPVVGKEQVTKGREMYWISIDRYYEGLDAKDNDSNAVKAYFQPRMCVQCENAPCEIVCPVGATVHSADGLNDMTYNRCVGTRYCSNNCPYKVRRFNFLTLQNWDTETIKLGRNPDVSVRSRGVMEKCTFCVQRIRGAEIVAEREQRPIKDGEILTACQSACPSGAIVFGDINDADAAVSKWKNEPTNYGLLAEINTRPRLTHMAVVRNPNPAIK